MKVIVMQNFGKVLDLYIHIYIDVNELKPYFMKPKNKGSVILSATNLSSSKEQLE